MAYTTNPRLPRVRMEAVRLVKYRGWSTRQVARHTGYSQSAIVKWCKKDTSGGWRPIPTKSSRPKHHPKQLKESIVRKIISLRFETRGRCSEVIHKMLLNDGINASLNSVKRILDRHGLINKRSPWKRYHPPTERPEALNPGDLIQVDTIHLMIEKKRIYVFTLIDVFSRWCYARAYERANCKTALHFLRLAQFYARFKFKNIQSDHGSEFSTHFTERVKINHRHSRVRKPNDNGHLERFNRTLQEECLRKLKVDVNVINKELPKYLKYYNERRLHLGINLQTPLQVITSYWG